LGMGRSLMSFHAVSDGPINATNLVGKVMGDADAKREAEAILTAQKERALEVIGANRDIVEALRDALVDRDELIGDEILAVINDAVARRRDVLVLPDSEPIKTTPPVEG
jgi:cell division protease FtsH